MTTRIQGCCMALNNVHTIFIICFPVLWNFFSCVSVINTTQATKCLKANSTINRRMSKKTTLECVDVKLLAQRYDRRRNFMLTRSKFQETQKESDHARAKSIRMKIKTTKIADKIEWPRLTSSFHLLYLVGVH